MMKQFLKRILHFTFLLLLIFMVGMILPATPRVSESILFVKNDKDSLLANVDSPRIIFLGASNLLLGLNSQIIHDSLRLNPINASLFWGIGLIYMMDNAINYIKSGDIVVVSSDYSEFYGELAYGREELLWTVLDVSPSSIMKLRSEQWLNIFRFLPSYSFSKFALTEWLFKYENAIYSRNSCNRYGDMYTHWGLAKPKLVPLKKIAGDFNSSIIDELVKFQTRLREKDSFLYITFPAYDSASFQTFKTKIFEVENELKKKHFALLGTPYRYNVPDSLAFDGAGHLTKEGCDYRTRLLIEDLKVQMREKHWVY